MKYIFVVGSPRSGTTLITTILSRNTKIAGTPETNFFNDLQYRLESLLKRDVSSAIDWFLTTRIRDLNLDRSKLLDALNGQSRMTASFVFQTCLEEFAKKQRKSIILEKSPSHIRHINEIMRIFPEAKVVWIVRDGRACVASLKGLCWASNNIETLSTQWVRNIAFGRYAEKRWPDRIIRVRYEELVTNPIPTLKKLHDVLDVPFEKNETDSEIRVLTVPSWEWEWKKKVYDPMDQSRLLAWQKTLLSDEIYKATQIMWLTLKQIGYEPGSSRNINHIMGIVYYTFKNTLLFNKFGLNFMIAAYRLIYKWKTH
jgi:hypothetical protein